MTEEAVEITARRSLAHATAHGAILSQMRLPLGA
jgi:hypothetical protein